MAFGRGTAREGDEMGFRPAIELGGGRGRPRAWCKGSRHPCLDKAPAHPRDGGQAHLQRLCDPLVRPARPARRFIRFEENPSMRLGPRRCLAGTQQGLQRRPLLLHERDPILDAPSV